RVDGAGPDGIPTPPRANDTRGGDPTAGRPFDGPPRTGRRAADDGRSAFRPPAGARPGGRRRAEDRDDRRAVDPQTGLPTGAQPPVSGRRAAPEAVSRHGSTGFGEFGSGAYGLREPTGSRADRGLPPTGGHRAPADHGGAAASYPAPVERDADRGRHGAPTGGPAYGAPVYEPSPAGPDPLGSDRGSARHDVPGDHGPARTARDPYRGDGYGADPYGPGGHGAAAYDRDRLGQDPHRVDSYGSDSYRADSYRADSYRAESHGADSYRGDHYRAADPYDADSYGGPSFDGAPYGRDPHGPDAPYDRDSYRRDSYGRDSYRRDSYDRDSYDRDSYGQDGAGERESSGRHGRPRRPSADDLEGRPALAFLNGDPNRMFDGDEQPYPAGRHHRPR
ncbi:MAG: hypothetical protein AB7S91_32070, partial [Pseudonocardia sp.]